MGLFYGGPFFSFWISVQILWSPLYPLFFIYLVWMHVDRNTPHTDGRRLQWVGSLWIYRRFRQYFPQTIVKTVDIPDDQNYIFCLFPHGICVTAGFTHFLTNCTDFNKLFPGIKTTFHTLNSNFLYPFLREYSLFSGLLAVSREALLHQLTKTSRGRAVVIVPGGAAEAMLSQPGTQRVILKNRKGFVKLAIITGTPLVPMYAFGETDLYDHRTFPRDSIVFKTQEYLRKLVGIAPVAPFINGGGFFQDRFGWLPRPRPVTTVVGKPIVVAKNISPSKEEVDAVHKAFVSELVNLFEEHKSKYITNASSVQLSIEEL
uniref:Acyltransferase n=4 Tax=Lygus hesperus TaxID=30085 RepID=A0A0A9WJU0_LYGHE